MTDELKTKCEKSFYSELYHFDETSQGLLIDNTTHRLYLQKTLETYDVSVYSWLKEHHSIHIPVIYSFREEDGHLTVIEEYIQGTTLDVLLGEDSLSYTDRLRIISDICDALSFLHGAPHPIIHRDIKASNVMLTYDGVVKLIDYDAAKSLLAPKERDTTLIGTVGSAAPEQYGFAQSDARTDIYSLGILIREMFPDDSRFSQIISKATRMEPDLRYQSAEELRQAILSLDKKQTSHRSRHFRLWILLISALFLLCGLLLAYNALSYRPDKHSSYEAPDKEAQAVPKEEAASSSDSSDDTEPVPYTAKAYVTESETANDSDSYVAEADTPLEITDSYWHLTYSGSSDPSEPSDSYISYGALITNPSDTMVAEYPVLRVTARNKSGDVLGTDDCTANYIMPKETIAQTFVFSIPSGYGSSDITVDLDAIVSDYVPAQGYEEPSCSDFEITGVSFHESDLFPNVTGEIYCNSDQPIESIKLTAVFRYGGKIKAMDFTFLDNPNKDRPTPFEIDLASDIGRIDDVEVYAEKWR